MIDTAIFDLNRFKTYDEYLETETRYKSNDYDIFVTPNVVVDVFKVLAQNINAENVLVTRLGVGKITNALASEGLNVDSIVISNDEKAIAERFSFNTYDDTNSKKYNLICGEPPFGGMMSEALIKAFDIYAEELESDGLCALVFPASIKCDKNYENFLKYVAGKGFDVDAVIDLPKGTYAPYTGIDTKMLIFSKNSNSEHFTAMIAEESAVNVVISNYINRISDKKYTVGLWVNNNQFFDIQDFEDSIRIKKALKLFKGEKILLEEIAKEVRRPKKDNTFDDIPNSIYIPKIGLSDVVDSTEKFKIKAQNYFQVIVDTEKVSVEYLCFFLNNPQGIQNRKSCMRGFIQQFNSATIKEIVIFIPTFAEQNAFLDTQSKIQVLKAQIDALESSFNMNPSSYKTVQENIRNINNYQTMDEWAETLPFPLSSILRRYFTENQADKKQEALLLFFEAYSIYNACILLSMINESIERVNLNEIFEGTDNSYFNKSSFGNWVFLNKIITNYVLKRLIDKDNCDENNSLLGLFKTNNLELIKILCNRGINTILYSVSTKRNEWKGHGGVASEQILEGHVIELERKLAELRNIVKDAFNEMRLIRAIGTHFRNNQAENDIEILEGSNSLFMKEKYISPLPLDETKLYLVFEDSELALPLLPLLIFKKSPENVKNACYFFSREVNDETKYVSYHYESKPEEIEPGHAVTDAITRIIPDKPSK